MSFMKELEDSIAARLVESGYCIFDRYVGPFTYVLYDKEDNCVAFAKVELSSVEGEYPEEPNFEPLRKEWEKEANSWFIKNWGLHRISAEFRFDFIGVLPIEGIGATIKHHTNVLGVRHG